MNNDEETIGEVPACVEAIAEALLAGKRYRVDALTHEPHGGSDTAPLRSQAVAGKLERFVKRKAHDDTEALLSEEVIKQANLVAKLTRQLAAFGR